MDDLIKALQIFRKYANKKWPTHCEHDVLYIVGITRDVVSDEDAAFLEDLGFFWSESDDAWISYQFGSA